MDNKAAIVTLVGMGTILLLIQMMFLASRNLQSQAERRLLRNWLGTCCLCLLILVVVPGAIEFYGLMPACSISLAGSIVFYLLVLQSSNRYLRSLAQLRASNNGKNGCMKSLW